MQKLTKTHLKSLIKECLFEILLDASDSSAPIHERKTSRLVEKSRKLSENKSSSNRPALDNISYRKKRRPEALPEVDTSAITSDPIMAAIFQDTAATTLREQAAAERGKSIAGADAATLVASNNDPSDLFGESSKNWAALAFSDSSKK